MSPSASKQSKDSKFRRFLDRLERDFDQLNQIAEFIGIPTERIFDDSLPWWNIEQQEEVKEETAKESLFQKVATLNDEERSDLLGFLQLLDKYKKPSVIN